LPDRKLKVFLSSTAQDLAAFRRAVHARLAASPLFDCIRQEDFGAQPHPPVDLCRQEVLQSDLFIGLIGMRRGWEPPEDSGRHSITEMEYDWAKDVARFMFVTPDDFPVPGNLRETDDEHRRQLGFRQRVMSELVVSQNGFVSQDGLLTPDILAGLVVDQVTNHVLGGDLIDRIRPPRTPDPSIILPDVIAQAVQVLQQRGVLKVAEQGGLERDVVLKLAKRLKPDDTLDFDRAVTELENAITIALDAIARGRRGSNEDDFVDEVLKRVGAHTQAGETERAVQALDDALKELDTREAEQRDTLKRSRLTLLQAGIAQDILRRDALSAARRVEQSVAIEHPDDLAQRFRALRARQDEFFVEGRDRGANFSLQIAIEIARRSIEAARGADQDGAALNDLGTALSILGEHESGTARLEEAVAAFRAALEERTRERAPLDWAATQNNLGNALWRIGERESGTARLEQAVAAFRAALEERTRERLPLQWAATQNNLGLALWRIGERESGTARLEEAVAAYRAALEECTRERVPLQWALTQHNLGAALQALGERESNIARFEEAVAAYRAALEERTRERVPLRWAMTQHNLGVSLQDLGERESGTTRLDEAVAAYRAALEELTRERMPLQWATSCGNQGAALIRLAERCGDAAMAATAVEQIEQALAVLRDAGHPPLAEYCETQLPEARAIRDRLNKA
jgi:tetratricopeptide (TPR) repeat protein